MLSSLDTKHPRFHRIILHTGPSAQFLLQFLQSLVRLTLSSVCLLVAGRMDHQLRGIIGRVVRITHRPVIPNGVSKQRSSAIEGAGRDGAPDVREGLELDVVLDIPEDKGAVRTASRDTALTLGIIGHGVACPDLDRLLRVCRITVAAPCEVEFPCQC
jgi:hypothetical protein